MKVKNFFCQALLIAYAITTVDKYALTTIKAEETLDTLQSKQQQLILEQNKLDKILNSLKDNDSKKEEYVNKLEDQIKNLCAQVDIENQKTFLLDKEIETKTVQIDYAQKKIDENLETFKKRLRAIYKAGGDTAFLNLILSTSSISDFFNATDVAQVIGKHDSKLFEELNSEMLKVEQEKNKIESQKQEISESRTRLEKNRKELEKIQKDNKKILEEKRKREIEEQERARAQAQMKAEAEARARLAKSHSEHTNLIKEKSRNGRYLWPVPSCSTITSYWGDGRGHKGIDIAGSGAYGAAIVAVADGVVTKSNRSDQWGSGWGYHVMVDHGSGYATQYAHCSVVVVSVGQKVKAGQVIGYVGNTGHSYGAHLHFETWKDGMRYDPMLEL